MFTKILYINLDRREDRNNHMLEQLKKINWTGEIERISGIDKLTLNYNDLDKIITPRAYNEVLNELNISTVPPGSYMSSGAVGCALSHRKAWINIKNNNHKKTLILEDDIFFDDDFNEKLNTYLNYIPDYELLYIGYHNLLDSSRIYNNYYNIPNSTVFGLYGYIVDKSIIDKLLSIFPINTQIDSYIMKIYPEIKVFQLEENKRIIHSEHSFTNKFGTDIQIIENYTNINTNQNHISINIIIFICIILYIVYNIILK